MVLTNRISLLAALAAAVAILATACRGSPAEPGAEATATAPAPTAVSTAAPAPSPTAEVVPAPSPSPTAEVMPVPSPSPTAEAALEPPFVYDPNLNMFLTLSGIGHPPEYTVAALTRAEEEGDTSQVPVILESALFFSRDLAQFGVETVSALTGQDFGLDLRAWREWLGPRRADYAPPPEYPSWKVNLLGLIDPEMAGLMEPAIEFSRADLTEILWGGVAVDGIPPLEDPPHVSPELAGYLEPDDRVFGVSINGEHRAYPLRIMNAHELANDELGGEPISLVY